MRKLIKEKLRVTKIPKLKLEDDVGNRMSFNDLYEYQNFLGAGGFGFVVQAVEKQSGEPMALKVSKFTLNNFHMSFLYIRLLIQLHKVQKHNLTGKLNFYSFCLSTQIL